MKIEDDNKREFEIYSTRFVNLHTQNPHAAGIQYQVLFLLFFFPREIPLDDYLII